MSARIKVIVSATGNGSMFWYCTAKSARARPLVCSGYAPTIAAAADVGRRHLRDHHPEAVWAAGGSVYEATYCRQHGVALTACEPYHGDTVSPAEAVRPSERRTERSRGYSAPLDKAHNEGSRR